MKKNLVIPVILLSIFILSAATVYSQNNDTQTIAASKICPISGETIEAGQGVDLKYLDKTITFCCTHCLAKFKKEPMDYIKEELKCPVSGEAAKKDIFTSVDGVKYYFSSESNLKKFTDDPSKYLNKDKN